MTLSWGFTGILRFFQKNSTVEISVLVFRSSRDIYSLSHLPHAWPSSTHHPDPHSTKYQPPPPPTNYGEIISVGYQYLFQVSILFDIWFGYQTDVSLLFDTWPLYPFLKESILFGTNLRYQYLTIDASLRYFSIPSKYFKFVQAIFAWKIVIFNQNQSR